MDLAIAVPALALSLPVQAATAVAVRHYLGRPVLFRQVRPGLHGEPFELIKFRTMKELDAEAGLVSDEDRLTPFGQFLRSTSLDEIPTLWNVVRGDMSIVGPRPTLDALSSPVHAGASPQTQRQAGNDRIGTSFWTQHPDVGTTP
ncbi:sugar transferase [Nostocoides australiense]